MRKTKNTRRAATSNLSAGPAHTLTCSIHGLRQLGNLARQQLMQIRTRFLARTQCRLELRGRASGLATLCKRRVRLQLGRRQHVLGA